MRVCIMCAYACAACVCVCACACLRLSHRTSREFVRLNNMLRVEKKKDVRAGMREKGGLRTFQRRFCEAKARIRLEIADWVAIVTGDFLFSTNQSKEIGDYFMIGGWRLLLDQSEQNNRWLLAIQSLVWLRLNATNVSAITSVRECRATRCEYRKRTDKRADIETCNFLSCRCNRPASCFTLTDCEKLEPVAQKRQGSDRIGQSNII